MMNTTTGEQPARTTTPVAEMAAGRRFEGRYACARKDRMTAKTGGAYLALELRDRTGDITARAFRDADRLATRFERGDAIWVKGKVERYRGELMVEVDDIRKLEPAEVDPAEFLPSAYRPVEELRGFLEHLVTQIHDPALRGMTTGLVVEGPIAGKFARAACTRAGHHAYLGGLIEHTVAVGTLVLELCQLHPRLDSDLLMTAALLHDIGKVREFTYGAEIGVSDEGRLLGHLAIGAEILTAAAGGIPEERRLALLNCILSHHGADGGPGKTRGGSGFATPEANALYRLNALDASVKGSLEGRS